MLKPPLIALALALAPVASAQDDRLRAYRGAVIQYLDGEVDEALRLARAWRPAALRSDLAPIVRDQDALLAPGVALLLTELAWKDPAAADAFAAAETLVTNLPRLSPEMREFRERWYAFMASVLIAELNPAAARTVIDRGLRAAGASVRLLLLSGLAYEMATYPSTVCAPPGCRPLDDKEQARALSLAAGAYRQALALEPESVDAHLRLGRVLQLLGDRAGARTALADVERLTGRADLRYLVALFRADLLRDEGDLPAALEEAERAVFLGPDYQAARIALAHLCDLLGMADRSRALVHALLELPESGDPWWDFRQPAADITSLLRMRDLVRR